MGVDLIGFPCNQGTCNACGVSFAIKALFSDLFDSATNLPEFDMRMLFLKGILESALGPQYSTCQISTADSRLQSNTINASTAETLIEIYELKSRCLK